MRKTIGAILILSGAVTIASAQATDEHNYARSEAANDGGRQVVVANRPITNLPSVAKNQLRPRSIHSDVFNQSICDYYPEDCYGGGGGDYTQGSCNCSRRCDAGPGCSLSTNKCDACKAITGGTCEGCIGPSNCGC